MLFHAAFLGGMNDKSINDQLTATVVNLRKSTHKIKDLRANTSNIEAQGRDRAILFTPKYPISVKQLLVLRCDDDTQPPRLPAFLHQRRTCPPSDGDNCISSVHHPRMTTKYITMAKYRAKLWRPMAIATLDTAVNRIHPSTYLSARKTK